MALVYIDARVIQDRLDRVLGVTGWQDKYELLPSGSAVCTLSIKIGSEWVSKMDVGSPSEQPDEGDRQKAAFSDALKRAAVKFGIGRYLYKFPQAWVDYDVQKKRLVKDPPIPSWAMPGGKKGTPPAAAAPPAQANGKHATRPPARLEAPYVGDNDPAELIAEDCQRYLTQLLGDKGYTVRALCERCQVRSLADLTYLQYDDMLKGLNSRPDRQVQNADG